MLTSSAYDPNHVLISRGFFKSYIQMTFVRFIHVRLGLWPLQENTTTNTINIKSATRLHDISSIALNGGVLSNVWLIKLATTRGTLEVNVPNFAVSTKNSTGKTNGNADFIISFNVLGLETLGWDVMGTINVILKS